MTAIKGFLVVAVLATAGVAGWGLAGKMNGQAPAAQPPQGAVPKAPPPPQAPPPGTVGWYAYCDSLGSGVFPCTPAVLLQADGNTTANFTCIFLKGGSRAIWIGGPFASQAAAQTALNTHTGGGGCK